MEKVSVRVLDDLVVVVDVVPLEVTVLLLWLLEVTALDSLLRAGVALFMLEETVETMEPGISLGIQDDYWQYWLTQIYIIN